MNQEEKIIELLAEIKELKAENAEYKKQKAYGLVWENEKNKEKIVEDCKKKLPILERVKDKEIITDKTKPMNLMVEGDNYHALTCLNYTHQGKIDVIYIDPPYNTGKAKEWKFNDKYVDKEDRFRHSKWLNMIEKRLRLAHNLLTDNGVIFISIDDNEQANLKLLCDEIFGEVNFITTFTWLRKRKPSHLDTHVRKNTEFLICFSKNINKLKPLKSSFSEDNKPYPFYNTGNTNSILNFPNNYIKVATMEDGIYKPREYIDKKTKVNLLDTIEVKEGIIINSFRLKGEWRYSQKSLDGLVQKNKQIIIKGDKFKPYYIRKLSGNIEELKNTMTFLGATGKIKKLNDFNFEEEEIQIGTNEDGEKELTELNLNFSHPKPISLLRFLIRISTIFSSTNVIILDFFAGSGTTGHAVMKLNKEDGGNRKFILCTNNENNNGNGQGGIAEAVCYPRIQKVIEGYKKNGDGEWVAGLGGNLHYFKADENSFISIEMLKKIDDKKKLELTLKAGELIAIRENIFDEKEHSKYYQIFEDNHKQVAIYFKEEQIKLNELMEKLDSKKEKIVYLFGWGKTLFSGDDLGYPDITVKDIPEPIIRIYQEING